MAKRSKALQNTLDKMNDILAMKEIGLFNQDRKIERVKSDTERAQLYKDGICTAIETMLHQSNSYKGYMYLSSQVVNGEWTEGARFDRKYF